MLSASLLSLLLLAAPSAGPAAADAGGAPDAAAEPARLALGVGAQKVLAARHLKGVAVAAPEVLDVRPLNTGELLLVGLAAGHSDLTLFFEDGTRATWAVEVGEEAPEGEASALRDAFKDSPGLAVQLVGDRIFLTGLFGSLEDYERSLYFPHVVCLARLDPAVVRARVAQVNEALSRAGFKNAQAVLLGASTLTLEGVVDDPQAREKARKIANAVFGPVAEAIDALERSPGR